MFCTKNTGVDYLNIVNQIEALKESEASPELIQESISKNKNILARYSSDEDILLKFLKEDDTDINCLIAHNENINDDIFDILKTSDNENLLLSLTSNKSLSSEHLDWLLDNTDLKEVRFLIAEHENCSDEIYFKLKSFYTGGKTPGRFMLDYSLKIMGKDKIQSKYEKAYYEKIPNRA